MRRTTGEKVELIRLVEGSDLSVRQPLRELRRNRSTFYAWTVLRLGRAGDVSRDPPARTHPRGAVLPHAAGEDRTLSPVDEEHREAGTALQFLGT